MITSVSGGRLSKKPAPAGNPLKFFHKILALIYSAGMYRLEIIHIGGLIGKDG
jgi:hypothetical protein